MVAIFLPMPHGDPAAWRRAGTAEPHQSCPHAEAAHLAECVELPLGRQQATGNRQQAV